MKSLSAVLVLSIAAPAAALAAPQGAPMTEPTPRAVMQAQPQVRLDRTARTPGMGRSTRAIMMPGKDMPMPARDRHPTRPQT